ncbi:uncharacterized protein LOC132893683 [Neoarius graeffei]|uniref:uncharacterized protein LOC132893683 n=1 Tax=Neoarius graeffei TaxID=443677 RepID=UPI00298CEBA9|nr:uncharacterized protein LOC132893683 [Neoarius graeffei]
MTGALLYILLIILLKGSCWGVLITQWPKYISSFKSTSVDMHCYQNDTNYDYTYWYRQIEGKALVLIASSVSGNPSQEKGFENGFKAWGTNKKWSLTVDVQEDSDAVYLCAARFHSEEMLKMWVWAYRLCILLSLLSSLSDCAQVKQPSDLIANLNDKVHISCQHNDDNLKVMLWYQQRRESATMALISYSYATAPPNNEAGYPATRFKQSKTNTVTGDLTISNLTLSDSAVYYCAARTTQCLCFITCLT